MSEPLDDGEDAATHADSTDPLALALRQAFDHVKASRADALAQCLSSTPTIDVNAPDSEVARLLLSLFTPSGSLIVLSSFITLPKSQ